MPSENTCINILRDYHSRHSLADIQLESYNFFVNNTLEKIIHDKSDIIIPDLGYVLSFKDVFLEYPTVVEEDRSIHILTPMEARTRDLNYEGTLSVNLVESINGNEKFHYKIPITKIPIMVKSCRCNLSRFSRQEQIRALECENDPGGYFIVNGKERVVVAQVRINYNQPYIYSTQRHAHIKYNFVAEMRSMSDETGHSTLTQIMIDNDKTIFCSIPYIKKEFPIHILFTALGVSFETYSSLVLRDDVRIKQSILNPPDTFRNITREKAIEYMSTYLITNTDNPKACVTQIIERELFPHVGISIHLYTNILCNMVRKLLLVSCGIQKADDRDNISNRRVESTGVLIGDLFRYLFKRFIKNLEMHLGRRTDALSKIPLCSPQLNQMLNYNFSTGNWSTQHAATYVRTGVSQILSRLSYIAMVSYLRKLIIPTGKEAKNPKIRQIHESSFGFIDPVETPEGQYSGISLCFSYLVRVSNHVPTSFVCDVIDRFGLINSDVSSTMILVNGTPVGYTDNHEKFMSGFRNLKSLKALPRDVSVVYNDTENNVHIYSDAGRLLRPVFTKNHPENVTDWNQLVNDGYIVYIDTNEAERSYISMDYNDKRADYYEIHPINILGVCSGVIAFCDHSQAPRNIYSTNMMKQAIGAYALNNESRTDTVAHMLCYPQKQLVSTVMARCTKIRDMPSGVNAIVAIACLTG